MADEQAAAVHRDAIVIDGCSFFSKGWSERLAIAGVTALQMTVPMTWDGARDAMSAYHAYYDLVERESRLTIIKSVDDIRQAKQTGKVGFILGAQNAQFLENDVRLVDDFQRLGVRVIQLAYNERNLLGDGCLEPANAGLSRFGKQVVRAMNRAGIQIDLSHVAERTSLEAIELSEKPCIFSHANPRARADNPRNISDEQIKRCAEAGGVIGATPYAPIAWTGGAEPPTLADVVGHIEYIVDVAGIDHVSFGTDSEATPGAYPLTVTKRLAADYPDAAAGLRKAHPGVYKTAGFASMEDIPALTAALLDRGWDVAEVRKLLGENLMRVYAQSWKVAA